MQSFPTVLIPFESAFVNGVEARLNAMGNPAEDQLRRELDKLRIIHFMSISAVPEAGVLENGRQGALLVIEICADGAAEAALTEVAKALGDPLFNLLREAGLNQVADDLPAFLIAHNRVIGQGWFARTLGLCFCGTPGMTVRRIRQEAALAWQVARMQNLLTADLSALCKLRTARERLWQQGAKWAFMPEPVPDRNATPPGSGAFLRSGVPILWTLLWPLLPVLLLPILALAWWQPGWPVVLKVLAATGAVVAVAVLAVLGRLRWLECNDIPNDAALDARRVSDAMGRENAYAQNLLVTVSDMKSGWLRRITLRAAFVAIGQLTAKHFRPGFLADIGSIHCARWVVLPGARKLVFLSNYDGSLESYLEDFIQKASEGVTAVWSNTVGFPRARWLFLDGARDGDRLRRSVLRQQIPARFWYSGYPSLTAARIRTNAAICRGITSAETEQAAEEWLACFGGAGGVRAAAPSPRQPATTAFGAFSEWMGKAPSVPHVPVETSKVTVLAFDRRKRLRHAACLMIRFGGDPAKCRAWLTTLEPNVGYGPDGREKQGVVLALAATAFGADKLALPPEDLKTFSPPFLNGMASSCRARALGDVGENAPDKWLWGGSQSKLVDALVIAYSDTADGLRDYLDALVQGAAAAGHTVARPIRFSPLADPDTPAKEPFGFVDGISQPWVRGLSEKTAPPGEAQFEPGEFVLGYRDNSGFLPPTPTVAAVNDPGCHLPPVPGDAGRRDLGRNGTYLAVRQLEQDPKGLAKWLLRATAELRAANSSLASLPACALPELVKSKLVGRWPNGSALAQHPGSPGAAERNDFQYGIADPSGLGCPFGAHTRRANPRDSFDPGSGTQMRITNRHRILRTGRKYDAANSPDGKPGLLFMCLNADIGRQFEFIQQTWLLGRNFHGLEDEVDPLLEQRRGAQITIPTQQGPARLRAARGLVTVKGGGYFFIPGRNALRYLADVRPA